MDLNTITDVKELKSMAYDQMVTAEQAQSNLRLINQRISQLSVNPEEQSEPLEYEVEQPSKKK